jgi:hypothetical protein
MDHACRIRAISARPTESILQGMFSKLAGLAVLELDWLIPVERGWSRGSEDCRPSLYSQARGKPDIFNIDQGSQFTGSAFTSVLATNGITICMDGNGAWRDVYLWVKRPMLALRSAATWTFIMGGVHTRVLTAPRPIKPTSPRCHFAWQPNPGSGPSRNRPHGHH